MKKDKYLLNSKLIGFIGLTTVLGLVYKKSLSSPKRRQRTAMNLIRFIFDNYNEHVIKDSLSRYEPDNIKSLTNINYQPGSKDAKLDIYYPNCKYKSNPVIVWIHGGGFITGSKDMVKSWVKIVAKHSHCAVVTVEYSVAPSDTYPKPVKQVNAALSYLRRHAKSLNVGRTFILAGDSAGAHIAAQVSMINTDKDYARLMKIRPALNKCAIKGNILMCGAYDLSLADSGEDMAQAMQVLIRAYAGTMNYKANSLVKYASITDYVSGNFSKSFISAGNTDPLLQHSYNLDKALKSVGVLTDTVFFPKDHKPNLFHEYQFNLDLREARYCFSRMIKFIEGCK